MIVGKAHDGKRGHGVRAARFAVLDESLKLGEPFAETRVAAAIGIGIVVRYGGIRRRRGIESGFVAIHGDAVRRGDVKTSKAQAMMVLERLFVGNSADGIRKIGIGLTLFLTGSFDVFRGNHGNEFAVIAVRETRALSGVP